MVARGRPLAARLGREALESAPLHEAVVSAAAHRVDAGLTLRVMDNEAAKAAILDLAASGGWLSELRAGHVVVQVPVSVVDEVVDEVGTYGDVLGRNYAREDLTADLAEVEGRLKAREDVLQRYLEVLETSGVGAIVAVEREITRVVAEIERENGRLRVLRDQSTHAWLRVDLRFKDRRAPRHDGSSEFSWINRLHVAWLQESFAEGQRGELSRAKAVAPEGFAPFDKTSRFQAVSADDVLYRVQSFKHQPDATLGFWSEALRTRMEQAGYTVLAEQEVTAATGEPGALLELGAADGEQDRTYLVTVFVTPGWLVVVEATGESGRFERRRGDVVAAIEQIAL